MTFAQGMLFLPVPRLVNTTFPEPCCKITIVGPNMKFPQGKPNITRGTVSARIEYSGPSIEGITRQSHSIEWNLLNQNWQFKLCPAQCDGLEVVLSKNDEALQTLHADDIRHVNTH